MRATITFICFIITFISFAQNDFRVMKEVEAFKKNLTEKTAITNSIIAEFKQEKFMSILSQQLISNGTIKFKQPNMVKWSYTTPYLYDIVLNGNGIIIDDGGKVNEFSVGSSKLFSEMNQLIINSVQGNVLDATKFNITYLENKEYFAAVLTPIDKKQLGAFLSEIEIYFDKQDYSVSRLKLVEPEEDYTQITFFNKQFNQAISDEIFSKK